MTIKISTRYARLAAKLEKVYADIASLQKECTHPNVKKEYKSNTGNYDPSCDSYWIDYRCPDCNKYWNTPQ